MGEAHHEHRGGEGGEGNSTRKNGGDGGWSDEGLPSGSRGSMWTADQLRRHLEDRFQVKFDDRPFYVVLVSKGRREEKELEGSPAARAAKMQTRRFGQVRFYLIVQYTQYIDEYPLPFLPPPLAVLSRPQFHHSLDSCELRGV